MAFFKVRHVTKISVNLGNTRVLHACIHGFTELPLKLSQNVLQSYHVSHLDVKSKITSTKLTAFLECSIHHYLFLWRLKSPRYGKTSPCGEFLQNS